MAAANLIIRHVWIVRDWSALFLAPDLYFRVVRVIRVSSFINPTTNHTNHTKKKHEKESTIAGSDRDSSVQTIKSATKNSHERTGTEKEKRNHETHESHETARKKSSAFQIRPYPPDPPNPRSKKCVEEKLKA